ncbi:S8 family peptidase [Georgenia sp. SYP-B2076]|uniref:S8 family peptidase n=1 Tax=Georgenia sp. SYP-B2076 TaxID=2495881 RepID=UPI000F8F54F7|nr:S8 family peptidase [Georgenia sp. SYP-B2076]
MSSSPWSRLRRRGLAATAAVGVVVAGALPAAAAPADPAAPPAPVTTTEPAPGGAPPAFEDGRYVVVMKDQPVIGYEGGTPGYAKTKPAKGEKFAPGTPEAGRYRGHLKDKQKKAARSVGATPTYSYTDAVSGFAAELTARQATALAKQPGVLAVAPDELRQPDTATSPDVLGLTGKRGVWDELGGTKNLRKGAGSGVVVGVIDTGIRPESPSFADNGMPKVKGFSGACETGEPADFSADDCTNKLVGARYYVDGFGADNIADFESLSPLDVDGHGTHTASTAAGNHGVAATIDGAPAGRISGMAPAAHVAAYKVCWEDKAGAGEGGCANSDSIAAIDQAVADGVDVINYSISGTSTNYLDAVELAFMFAADGGVFVAASSGNSGPGVSTTAHPSPWLTTVAASTHAILEHTLVTGDGARYIGSSVTGGIATDTPLVLADSIATGATAAAALCLPGSIDPARAAGKIVVCDRGENPRGEKSQVVAAAGGVGMVLVNTTPNSLDTDVHAVPTVHLAETSRPALRAYVSTHPAPTGRILETNEGSTTLVPEVAGFSSRGPSLAGDGDLLKPDVSAPGVGVLAAYSPTQGGRDFDYLSGTSMSSPHIAGLAALLKQAHPRWSPMAIKSAMMTTADDHASAASSDPFASGAGFVDPDEFLNPGVVYDSDQADWWDFLAGQGVTYADGTPVSRNPIDASNLNTPSIAVGALVGEQTVTRTLTNATNKQATFTARVDGLAGVGVKVSPSKVTLKNGRSADVTITFTTTTATLGEYATGHLTWTGSNGTAARSPIVVKPVALAAPAQVSAPVDAAGVEIPVEVGFAGTLSARVFGLVPGLVTAATARNAGGTGFDAADPRNYTQDFTVGDGAPLVRIELRSAHPGDDLDLYVTAKGSTTPIASAATGSADEVLQVGDLPPGEYTIHVQAWAVADAAPSTTLDVRLFQVPDADAGTLVLDRPTRRVAPGDQVTFAGALATDGVTPYFGQVELYNGSEKVGVTSVSVG